MTLLLMLACLRRLPDLQKSLNTGWFDAWHLQDRFGELGGRTVGLVGYGAVPKILHPVLEALGARVLFWSCSRKNRELPDLLSQSDIVSLHLPLAPDTQRLIDPRRLKRGAILVNTARGGLVQEEFLSECLESGHLAAAGLDVFATEPLESGSPLLALPSVICTPHVAWLTQETLERSVEVARANVQRLKSGAILLHRVI